MWLGVELVLEPLRSPFEPYHVVGLRLHVLLYEAVTPEGVFPFLTSHPRIVHRWQTRLPIVHANGFAFLERSRREKASHLSPCLYNLFNDETWRDQRSQSTRAPV